MLNPTSLVSYRVTIPEGFTAAAIVARIADTDADHRGVAAGRAGRPGFPGPAVVCGRPAIDATPNGKVEGFLFPATYDIAAR